jgi:homoserine dehydrogenase
MPERKINIGMLGLGTVGTGVVRVLQKRQFQARPGVDYRVKTIAVADVNKPRRVDLNGITITSDAETILNDPEIDIVIETIGGREPAFSFICQALRNHKPVVTANKALIATCGGELLKIAAENEVDLLCEASVGGGIPIIKGLREGLAANRIESIYAILNGTSNYILTRMHQEELEFEQALKEAQAKGFAEADPALDVGGGDAAHKLTILASIASAGFVNFNDLYVEGITGITKLDISFAKQFGFIVKLLAIYRSLPQGLDLRVHPTLIQNSHQLAAVNHEMNAVFVKGDFVGNTMFYGPGAGERPTASAIAGDVIDLSNDLLCRGSRSRRILINPERRIAVTPVSQIVSRFYLRFFTLDMPGVLAQIATVLGKKGISISSVMQLENQVQDNYVPIVILTHKAQEQAMNEALQEIAAFDFVKKDYLRLRIFDQNSIE